ncbi:hypothetical protein SLEP1_g48466 [Rubroshorea leprosula]|uniref:TIR domain-containing protein n=1 Tax=Rubroshorea leprosula TaxID=152421 RepID=A0AAV5LTP9_9ROSI|nr:hypothetical protein SLEP1_g48466 [Rubroshorea leprosula]
MLNDGDLSLASEPFQAPVGSVPQFLSLRRGEEISPSFIQAIEDSAASIVIISPDYASSHRGDSGAVQKSPAAFCGESCWEDVIFEFKKRKLAEASKGGVQRGEDSGVGGIKFESNGGELKS